MTNSISNSEQYTEPPRQVPANDLDMQMQITNPAWQRLSPQLRSKLVKIVGEQNITLKDGTTQKQNIAEELHGLLGIYTRDVRLGNLSAWNGEFDFVRYYLEFSVDLLSVNMPDACICALNRALSVLELSNSKSGFLRKLINTIRQENYSNVEPEKRNLMGASPGKQVGRK